MSAEGASPTRTLKRTERIRPGGPGGGLLGGGMVAQKAILAGRRRRRRRFRAWMPARRAGVLAMAWVSNIDHRPAAPRE